MARDPVLDARRLATLRDTGATAPSARGALDDLAELASERLGAPVSLVSLVDDDRQVFAGQAGLDGPLSLVLETPLSHSFCQHVVRADAPLVVADLTQDPVLRENLAVRDMHVRAYAGVPLRVQGATLGALCVLDTTPRAWAPDAVGALTELAGVAEARLAGALRRPGDALTGLLDGEALAARADEALRRAAGDGVVCALAVGVDDVGAVNEALGFHAGDELLRHVAARVKRALTGAAVGRVDGDVFLAICERDATACAERLQAAVAAEPVPVGDESHVPTVRIGIATSEPGAPLTQAELLERARRSLADVRALGALIPTAAREQLAGRAAGAERVRAALPGALARDEMTLLFAPLRRVTDGTLAGLEARLRWDSGSLGHVARGAWLPVAAQSGDVVTIGEWALHEACARFAAWRREGRVGEDVALVVPLCPAQLGPAGLPDVAGACAAAGLPPAALHIRVPPGARTAAFGREILEHLAATGVRLIGAEEDGIVVGEPAAAREVLAA